jgi:carboxyl-terminal processing protease
VNAGRPRGASAPDAPSTDPLQACAFTDASLPDDFAETIRLRVSNAELAALVEDPDRVRLILDRRRLDGLEQDVSRPTTPAGVSFHINLALFADARRAREEIADPVAPAGFAAIGALTGATACPLPVRRLALSRASAMRFENESPTGAPILGLAVRFAVGRMVAVVAGIGPRDTLPVGDVWLLAAALQRRIAGQRLPPATAAALAALGEQTDGETILYNAFTLLHGFHHRPRCPRRLLHDAYQGAAAFAAAAGVDNVPALSHIVSTEPVAAWEEFVPAYRRLRRLIGNEPDRALAHAAARTMYDGHDCHTAFLDPPLFRRFVTASRGEVRAGLGMTISVRPPHLMLRVLPASPAEAAGLRAGDELVAVGGRPLADMGAGILALLAQGDGDEPLSLTVHRHGARRPSTVTVRPRRMQAVVERHMLLPGGIGYCELNEFPRGDEAVERVAAAFAAFAAAGAQSWVLDLRYDGGGWARTLCRIAGLFLPEGSLLTTRSLPDGREEQQVSVGAPIPDPRPMAVLIGPTTASAAEILAESLRAHGRAVLVGGRTSGCVNGGRHFALLDGSGVRLAEYAFLVGPRRARLEHAGVEPDVVVERSREDLAAGRDPQLAAAVRLLTGRDEEARDGQGALDGPPARA